MQPEIQLFSGGYFNYLKPEECDFKIDDVAHSLSHQCRFSGHVHEFYSVAQHSCHVADSLRGLGRTILYAGLAHDMHEAYVLDIPSPMKLVLPEYCLLEARVQAVVCKAFGVDLDVVKSDRIKQADLEALATEHRDLLGPADDGPWDCINDVTPWDFKIKAWSPLKARHEFLQRFALLQ